MGNDELRAIGRALTYEQKREVLDKILGAWMAEPAQRLGQLIENSLWRHDKLPLGSVEDEILAQIVTDYTIYRANLLAGRET